MLTVASLFRCRRVRLRVYTGVVTMSFFANDYDKHACATYRENIGDYIDEKRN